MADDLKKASPNVKANREKLTPMQVFERLAAYAKRNGFHAIKAPHHNASIDGAKIRANDSQPISHELGHAFMTPVGETADEYTKRLSRDGAGRNRYDSDGNTKPEFEQAAYDEDVASVMEPSIARRAGVSPKQVRTNFSPNPHKNPAYVHLDSVEDDRPAKEIHADLLDTARHHLNRVETGQKVFQNGKAVQGTGVNAKINARANTQKAEPSAAPPFTISTKNDGADFHIHSIGAVAGKPAEAPSATTYGVRANHQVLDPRFLRYVFEHAHMSGRFKPYTHGTAIQHLTTKDAYRAMVEHMNSLYGNKTQKSELSKATPVSRIRLPKPREQVTDDMIEPPSAIGQGERDLRNGTTPRAPVVPEPFVPAPQRGITAPIDYSAHVLPERQAQGGYRVQAFESPYHTAIHFSNPMGMTLGSAHIEHPDDPDTPSGHRFEIDPKIAAAHHKVILDYLARAVRHHLYGPPASPIKKAEGKRADWLGRPVVHPKDGDLLEMNAAIHEFQGKLPRSEAEDRAHSEYRREHHLDGAAHHLVGMKVAQAADQIDEAQKHGALYALHMRALGHDPHAEVPGEVKSRVKPENQKLYRFRPHKADLFVLDQKDSLSKHEIRMGDILKKGDVIQFPGNPAPAQEQKRKAKVLDHPDVAAEKDAKRQERAKKKALKERAQAKLQAELATPHKFRVGDVVKYVGDKAQSWKGKEVLGEITGRSWSSGSGKRWYDVAWTHPDGSRSTAMHAEQDNDIALHQRVGVIPITAGPRGPGLTKGEVIQFPGKPKPPEPEKSEATNVVDANPAFEHRRAQNFAQAVRRPPEPKRSSPVVNAAPDFAARGALAERSRDAKAQRTPSAPQQDAPVMPMRPGIKPPSGLASMPPRQAWDEMIAGRADPSELPDDQLLGLMAWNDPDGTWNEIREAQGHRARYEQGLKELGHAIGKPNMSSEDLWHFVNEPDRDYGDDLTGKGSELMRLQNSIDEAGRMTPDREGLLEAMRTYLDGYQPVNE